MSTGPAVLLSLGLAAMPCGGKMPSTASTEVVWEERIEVDSGRGYRGPWRMNESRFLYVDDPTVASNGDGSVGVVWADQARRDLFFQRFGPDGDPLFEKPTNVSRSPRVFSWLPRAVMTSGNPGEVYVLWQEIVFSGGTHGGEAFFARSTDGGRSFERPRNLSRSKAGDGKGRLTERRWHNGSLDLVRGPGGELYAAWTEYEGTLWLSRSTNEGRNFSSPLAVTGSGDSLPARGPSLAVAPDGTLFLAWTVGENREADIRWATSRDRGRSFGEIRIAYASDSHSDAPKIAADEGGTIHLVFDESESGPFGRSRVLYTRLDRDASRFERPRRISGGGSGDPGGAAFPALDFGPAGTLFALWEHYPAGARRPRGLGYALSRDGGASFSPPSVIPGTLDPDLGVNGSQQGLLSRKLAVDDREIAVVNSTFREGEESRVWLYRGKIRSRSPDQDPPDASSGSTGSEGSVGSATTTFGT
ncbi:MAG: sialidase family protein [Thermoanaerobaculia bacterium]|nr:sialidase family protein [Thermoanaerobaculia bacterium]